LNDGIIINLVNKLTELSKTNVSQSQRGFQERTSR